MRIAGIRGDSDAARELERERDADEREPDPDHANDLPPSRGELLAEQRLRAERGENLADKVAVTTIVSSAMVDALAAEYGFELRRCLTGF